MILLCLIKHLPCFREEYKAVENQNVACDMERSEVRIATPSKEVLKKVSGIVCEEIDTRKFRGEPSREKIYGKWESIHLCKQGNKKRRECAKRPPVSRCFRLSKAERKDNENQRIYNDKWPEAVGVFHDDFLVATPMTGVIFFIFATFVLILSTGNQFFLVGMFVRSTHHKEVSYYHYSHTSYNNPRWSSESFATESKQDNQQQRHSTANHHCPHHPIAIFSIMIVHRF